MPDHAQDCMSELISRFHERLDLYGCLSSNGPFAEQLLENDIIPMFGIDRWATGPNQLTTRSYRRTWLALRLATLFLTEDCTLGWFTHYTFGVRKRDASGHTYIAATRYASTKEARKRVKYYLGELGKVVTLMLRPTSAENDRNYGVTYHSKRHLPFFRRFRERDWPSTIYDGRCHPTIVLHNDFYQYFSTSTRDTDQDTWFRTNFLFAVTLVHEIAHAYSMWLGTDRDEPLFRKDDRTAELGFSWETETLGYICNPVFNDIVGCQVLLAIRAVDYHDDRQHRDIVSQMIGQHPLYFNHMNPAHFQDLFHPQDYRGGGFYTEERTGSRRKWLIAVYALSLEWIASWFEEQEWEVRRCNWHNFGGRYVPTPLESFVLVYQKNGDRVWVHYPLDPRIQEDLLNIPMAAEQERLRGGVKLPQIA